MDPRIKALLSLPTDKDGFRDGRELDLTGVEIVDEALTKVRLGSKIAGAKLKNADLTDVELSCATVPEVEFIECRFTNCVLSKTWFSKCVFKHSTLDRCTFTGSVFLRCDLYRVVFISNNLMQDTRFSLVSISQATLGGTIGLHRRSFDATAKADLVRSPETQPGDIGDHAARIQVGTGTCMAEDPVARSTLPKDALIQQVATEYWPLQEVVPESELRIPAEDALERRLDEAAEAWRCLSALWSNQGFAADAGWAYVKARRLERKDSWPGHAGWAYVQARRLEHKDSSPCREASRSFWSRVRRFGRWASLWLADIVCEFGNNVLLAICWLPVLVLIMGTVFCTTGTVHTRTHEATFVKSLLFSVTQMVNVSPGGLTAHGSAAHLLASVEVFLGVALLGLIGFVLGNKIRNS